ncbi:hypothetical protein [Mesorhizobium sp. M1403]|uniref:hypothetical protein n=1 Tax=Mesorhizobium sp. M1403 TaxID=2957097 RepID=UPI00333D0451
MAIIERRHRAIGQGSLDAALHGLGCTLRRLTKPPGTPLWTIAGIRSLSLPADFFLKAIGDWPFIGQKLTSECISKTSAWRLDHHRVVDLTELRGQPPGLIGT